MFTNKQKTRFTNVLIGKGAWNKQNQFKAPTNSDELDRWINNITRQINELDNFDRALKRIDTFIVPRNDDDDDAGYDLNEDMIFASNSVHEFAQLKELTIYSMYSALRNHIHELRNSDFDNELYKKFEDIFSKRFHHDRNVRLKQIIKKWGGNTMYDDYWY